MLYPVLIAGAIASILYAWYFWLRRPQKGQSPKKAPVQPKTSDEKVNSDRPDVFEAENIIPLTDFDWRCAEPVKVRPFKPKYHLTMGLINLQPSSFITIDSTYIERLALRSQILNSHSDIAMQSSPAAEPAIKELYTWLTSVYLPTRYPTLFKVSKENNPPTQLLNLAFLPARQLPLLPPSDPFTTLKLLGENVDQDFLFMLKDEETGEYVLRGYVVCFPSGFNTQKKFGLSLKDIHAPVPGYKEKLEKSMDRFFDRIEVGRLVARTNWTITTTSKLFMPGGTHLYEGQDPKEREEFDINDVHLRTESQTLHRLPLTRALLFTFHTSLYPLSLIKEEGSGEDLCQAIDGLKSGSVPEMEFYKSGVVWGERVKAYLRS